MPREETQGQLHDFANQLVRNGKWGTCNECPRRVQQTYPEECEYTDRYDHQLTADDFASHCRRLRREKREGSQ